MANHSTAKNSNGAQREFCIDHTIKEDSHPKYSIIVFHPKVQPDQMVCCTESSGRSPKESVCKVLAFSFRNLGVQVNHVQINQSDKSNGKYSE